MPDHDTFELGNFKLQSGRTLAKGKLAYKTYGTLNSRRDNAIVYPTFYSGKHTDNEPLIGDGLALDPQKYFIIVPNMFGNGVSSSPSNTPTPLNKAGFPNITLYDNIMAHHRLVTEKFGIERIELVCGFSMGAQQTFHWGALFPDMVARIMPWCGSAKTSRHNFVFLEGGRAALTADAAWKDGRYDAQPAKGLRAFARVYAGWGPSQAFYREEVYRKALGFETIEDYIVGAWEERFLEFDANDLMAMLWSWQNADISANPLYNGDFHKALGAIKARAIVMPSETDQYFPVADNAIEVGHMPNAELLPLPTIWGHLGGGPGRNPDDTAFINRALKQLLLVN
ncbi:MAG: alpha/beta fold hydrolase [Chloroflexi bacterium]|nr:alpha/beta fold hydrolase [Chloroflexota bacterium]